jgi:hypothetical protein
MKQMNKPYWEVENPAIVEAGKQRFKYYKQSGVLEISTKVKKGDEEKEIRRQTISAYKLKTNDKLRDMVLDFLEDSGLVRRVKTPPPRGE